MTVLSEHSSNRMPSTKRPAEEDQEVAENGRKRAKKSPPDFSNPGSLVKMAVGEEKMIFFLHKEVACYYSPVLNAAFNSGFNETETQSYSLEDITQPVFQKFAQWIYSNQIRFNCSSFQRVRDAKSGKSTRATKTLKASPSDLAAKETTRNASIRDPKSKEKQHKTLEDLPSSLKYRIIPPIEGTEPSESPEEKEYLELAMLWVLADRLLVPRLQNYVLHKLNQAMTSSLTVPFTILHYVYENTGEDSELRKYLVEVYICLGPSGHFKNKAYHKHYPQAMVMDLLVASYRPTRKLRPVSEFHVPTDER